MKSEGWIDVQIRTAVDTAELLGMLADPVIQDGWEENGVVHLYWPKPQWSMEARARLNSILQGVDPDASTERDIRVEKLPIRMASPVGSIRRADSDRSADCDQAELGAGGAAGTGH